VIGRIVKAVDFERVLRTPPRSRGQHFVFHHVADVPMRRVQACKTPGNPELSTAVELNSASPVDECAAGAPTLWLGAVVPKRHARRAVSRSLIKRQIRAAFASQGHLLDGGLWVVRLRTPFDRAVFPSAASAALQAAVRLDIAAAMSEAQRPRNARPHRSPSR